MLDHQVSHLRVSAGAFAHPRRAICRASVCRSPSGLANLVHSPILSLCTEAWLLGPVVPAYSHAGTVFSDILIAKVVCTQHPQ